MKRKLIELGGSVYISLPSTYVKANNLVKGAEIHVNQEKGELTISTSPQTKGDTCSIDFEKEMFIVKRYVTALYRRGYSTIKLKYTQSHQDVINEIRDILTRTTIGFEIISQKSNEIIVQSFANENNEELDNVIKRTLYLIKEFINEINSSLTNNNTNLRQVEEIDIEIDKFTNYCCRLIFKGSNIGKYKNIILFNFIKNLEYFADSLLILSRHIRKNNYNLNKFELEIMSDIATMFDHFIKLYSKYSIKDCEKTASFRMHIRKNLKKKDSILDFHIRNSVRRFNDTLSNLIELQL